MFTYTLTNFYATCLNSMYISITCITRTPCPYNFTSLFKALLIWYAIWLSTYSMVTNLGFLADVVINAVLFTNITSTRRVKISVACINAYLFSHMLVLKLLVLRLTVLPFTPSRSFPKIYFVLLVSFTVIGQLGRNLLITIYLYSRSFWVANHAL